MLLSNAVRRAGRKAQRNEGGNAERQKVWKAGWLASAPEESRLIVKDHGEDNS